MNRNEKKGKVADSTATVAMLGYKRSIHRRCDNNNNPLTKLYTKLHGQIT